MVSVKNVLLFTTGALALMAIPRDVGTILSDLTNIDTKVRDLGTALTNYKDDIPTALPIDVAVFALNSAISDATDRAGKSTSLSEAEAKQVVDYVNNTLQPDVKATVDVLLVKAPIFKENNEGFFVYLYISLLKDTTSRYAAALLPKAPASSQTAGKAALQAVLDQIDRAVNTVKP